MIRVTSVPIGVRDSVHWLSRRVSTVSRRCMRSWSVPNAAMEPIRPLRTATQTMLGLVKIRLQNSGAPGAGPQLITFSRPASYAVWSTAPAPPSMRETREQELVDRRDLVAIEGRDEDEGDGPLGQARADEELGVLPVLAVGGGGDGDDRHGADLGGQERQAGGPRGHAAAGEEEVDGVVLLAGEAKADVEQQAERPGQDGVIRPGERAHGRGARRPSYPGDVEKL